MSEVFGFDSIEEAIDFIRDNTDRANSTLHPKQRAITYGDYWVQFYDLTNRVCIWGQVMPLEQVVADEMSLEDEIAGPSEAEVRSTIQGAHDRGYMFGRAYSVIEPAGELGNNHRANMWPISERLYRKAALAVWSVWDFDTQAREELESAYQEWRDHQLTLVPSERR